jgi:hypothetical protein
MNVAVVTGGHAFDVPNFHRLFRAMPPEMDVTIQSLDDFASSPEAVRDGYDAVVFYIMMRDGPTDEGHPWYAGKPKTALEHLGATRQGIVVLHHAILAYPEWLVWHEITGIPNPSFGYHIGLTVTSHIVNPQHPITRGLADWTMIDETYTTPGAGPDSEVLLTYDHPQSMKTIAWTRTYRNARVFCYQAGHDNRTWVDGNFRTVLARGIQWTAGGVGPA